MIVRHEGWTGVVEVAIGDLSPGDVFFPGIGSCCYMLTDMRQTHNGKPGTYGVRPDSGSMTLFDDDKRVRPGHGMLVVRRFDEVRS